MSTIVDGQGLNITVQSYLDTLDFGLVSCRELVPDVWDIADGFADAVLLLKKRAEEEAGNTPAAKPRRATKKTSARKATKRTSPKSA